MPAQISTHATLLHRLADGSDASAWTDFQDRYGELIIGYARRKGAQTADCEDIQQDVLITLTKAMPEFRYDPARGRFRSYLKTIVSRAVFKKFRQKQGEVNLEAIENSPAGADDESETDELWEAEWRQYHLRQAMQTIDVEFNQADRMAFRHYVVGGEEPGKTAELLGITVNQVYKAKSNILKHLGELIAQQVEEEG